MSKCIPMVMEDGSASGQDQAVAMCSSKWDEATRQAKDWTFNLRSVNEDERIIEGIATTPAVARDGDIVEPRGMRFKLPLPLLLNHDLKSPIGNVVSADVSDEGIRVRAQIGAPGVAEHIDEAWRMIKSGIVRFFSIRWKNLEPPIFDKAIKGFRHVKTDLMELSVVSVPIDTNAAITTVRSIDGESLACLGKERRTVSISTPAWSGLTKGKSMTILEQITQFENKRAALSAKQDEIVAKAEGRTFDEAETQEHDTLDAEIKQIDEHLPRLRSAQERSVARAVAVPKKEDAAVATAARMGNSPIKVTSQLPKGIGFARMAIAKIQARTFNVSAEQYAREVWPDQPEVSDALKLRSIVEAGDTTTSGWASQLVPSAIQLSSEFLDLLRPATILGRIPGLRRVPFNVAVPVRTAAGTFGWVGEAAAKPVTSETFSSVTLRWAKAAGIIVITQELARFSNPSAEAIIRDSMVESLTRFFDTEFVSANAEVSNVSPAGILNGIASTGTTGTSMSAFRTDMNNMLNNFTANNVDPTGIVLLMSATQALALSLAVTDLNVRLFPNISVGGGDLLGFPVIVSENVGTKIIALKASDILVAEDPGVRVDVSDQATIEMETAPAVGEQSPPSTQSVLKSMFQNNLIALRAEQYITWKKGRTAAVEYITGNAYVP